MNLRATPRARVELGRETVEVDAREARSDEVKRYWPRLIGIWPAYDGFFQATGERSIFVLTKRAAVAARPSSHGGGHHGNHQ
jgi:hypothetical protein